ncbi:phosphoesterase [Lujinxingia vulgaris]|uniref:Phosphoesterase n=1 Tax=Lujinxingia vulgaris TaxID=2600176 RepID=A0A5C6XJ28_9DELT|nr:phosphoesterase [Lujinxingia vulgaris]TXD38190.1 phosphoesterase [Lujinxingia vulgaris]
MSPARYADETIAFVPRAELEALSALEHGFRPDAQARHYAELAGRLQWALRAPLEDDPSRKQLIPYVVVHNDTELFRLRRLPTQGEARLHDKLSLGVGGHIARDKTSDAPAELHRPDDALWTGMLVELYEELYIDQPLTLTYRGLINDDTNEVGKVHLGVVFSAYHVGSPDQIRVRETDKMVGEWVGPDELQAKMAGLESWSQLIAPEALTWLNPAP